jgi:tetratricopeptide (TPR) repeat protein
MIEGALPMAPPAPRRSRVLRLALVLLVLGLAGAAGWYGWRRSHAPRPPAIDLEPLEPAVAEAIRQATARVRQSPYAVEPWAELAMLLRASQMRPEAAACFGTLEAIDPRSPRWPYLRGEALLLHGEEEAARAALDRAVALDGNDVVLRLRLAEALLALGRAEEAATHLQRAREIDPDNPNVLLGLALAAGARDDTATAEPLLERCQHSPFTRRRATSQRAALLQRRGDAEGATSLGRRAAALPPDTDWPDPYLLECLRRGVGKTARLRYVEGLEARDRFSEAVTELRALLAEGPDPTAQAGLARNLYNLGQLDEAERAARAALAQAPANVQAHYLMSRIQWQRAEQGRREGKSEAELAPLYRASAEEAQEAARHRPGHALALVQVGLARRRLGERAAALEALRAAVAAGPELAEPHLRLGEALAEAGQVEEARRHLRYAAELARPDDKRAPAALERLNKGGGRGKESE